MRLFVSVIVLAGILSLTLVTLLVISSSWRWFSLLKLTKLLPPDFENSSVSVIILLSSSDISFSSLMLTSPQNHLAY